MFSLLLVIIYLSFISLGLPDSILGAAWPSMYEDMNVPISYMGIISMIISAGTVISSLMADKFIRKIGIGLLTAFSVGMTALALIGFSFSMQFWMLCLCAIPYGLGAGAVDSALNNYVALHYESRHMSWLHCFWGVGATIGPYVMGYCLTIGRRWNSGYRIIGFIQIGIVVILALSLPLWNKVMSRFENESSAKKDNVAPQKAMSLGQILAIPGAKMILTAFFCYCAAEATTGLWASTFMVSVKGINAETAASWASFFYIGITLGRFVCGFFANKAGDKIMVRIGQGIVILGCLLIMLPLPTFVSIPGILIIGVGCAPIYPSLLHETPENFGPEKSQAIMGVQMACAYIGTTLVPPLFGLLSDFISLKLYPYFIFVIIVLQIVMVEVINRRKPA